MEVFFGPKVENFCRVCAKFCGRKSRANFPQCTWKKVCCGEDVEEEMDVDDDSSAQQRHSSSRIVCVVRGLVFVNRAIE